MMAGRRRMQKAWLNLPAVSSHADGLPIYFLTGKKYIYQTLFCIQSLANVSDEKFRFTLVDDGTFDAALEAQLRQKLPGAHIILQSQIAVNINTVLPADQYPRLHHKRKVYPHIKKLTDIHSIANDTWKLVLDSDMLFWHNPAAIINWLNNPDKPIYMLDCVQAYGYTTNLMKELSGNDIADMLNVGVIGLKSASINWPDLERWVTVLEKQEGTSYYLEQALTAMLIGSTKATVLPTADYIVNPAPNVITGKKGVLHHYVDLSKEGYFKKAWKAV